MTWKETKSLISLDLGRSSSTTREKIKSLLLDPVLKTLFLFRIGTYLRGVKVLRPLLLLNSLIYRHYRYKTGISIEYGTRIEGGVKIFHFQSVIINGGVRIGKNCTLYHDVTIGASLYDNSPVPVLGDNVVVCTGAKILGNVKIGDNVIIAANAVVTKDVPSNAIVGGIPAKVISVEGKDKARLWLKKSISEQ